MFLLKHFPPVRQPESEFSMLKSSFLGMEGVSLSDNPTALSQRVRHTAGKLRESWLVGKSSFIFLLMWLSDSSLAKCSDGNRSLPPQTQLENIYW